MKKIRIPNSAYKIKLSIKGNAGKSSTVRKYLRDCEKVLNSTKIVFCEDGIIFAPDNPASATYQKLWSDTAELLYPSNDSQPALSPRSP
jgi:hypothetical protein